jgi:hypothetical protein
MSRSWRRASVTLFSLIAFALALPLHGQAPAAAPVPPRPPADTLAEPVVIDIRLGKLGGATVQAFRLGDEVLLPLGAFLDLAEVRHDPVANGQLGALLQPGDRRLLADARTRVVSVEGTRITLAPSSIRVDGEELYLAADALARVLGIAFRVDWAELSVNVDDPAALPIALRLARMGGRASRLRAASDAETPPPVDVSRTLAHPLFDGAVLDYAFAMPSARPLENGSFALQFGADLLGGALQSNIAGLNGLTGVNVHTVTSWTGVWRDSRVVKQARVGSTITTGPGPQAITGATLTNAPFVRAAAFGVLEFPGQVGPHWEVEVYRDGLLVAVDSTDAQGRFRVPIEVRYGTNLVKFIGYGPHGEVRDFTGSFLLVDNLIPAGHFEYAASAGRCTGSVCRGAANLDFRYGLARTWTIRAGLDGYSRDVEGEIAALDTVTASQLDSARRVRDTASVLPAIPIVPLTAQRLSRLYASISGNPIGALNVTLGATQHTSTNLAFQYQPSSFLTLVGSRTAFLVPISDALLGLQGVQAEERISGFWRPFGERRSLYIDVSDVVRHTITETQATLRTSVSFEHANVRYSPYLLRESHQGSAPVPTVQGYGVSAFVPPIPRLGRILGALSLRPALESRDGQGIDQMSLGFARSVGSSRIDGNLTHSRSGGQSFSMTLTTDFSRFRAGSSVNMSSGTTSAAEFMQGSVLFDRTSRTATLFRGPALGRSGVNGRVFLDANGNGLMDAGEDPLPNVSVRVGSLGVQTDSLGRFHVWDVPSFEPVLVQLDTATFTNPVWTPTEATVSVQPGPHRFEPVNFAIVVGGAVEGRVVRTGADGSAIPVPGATVTFRDLRTNAERSIDTFSDGSFTATGVRPGNYMIRVDDATLTALRGSAEAIAVHVKASPDGSLVREVELTVKPVQNSAVQVNSKTF